MCVRESVCRECEYVRVREREKKESERERDRDGAAREIKRPTSLFRAQVDAGLPSRRALGEAQSGVVHTSMVA